MLCHVYEFEVWTWRTWLYNKFELSNFWKEIKLQTNYKQIFWHCFSNLLLVNCIVLGYSSLNISSTIRDLKLKGMPKYNQVWTCYTCRRIKHDCFFLWLVFFQVSLPSQFPCEASFRAKPVSPRGQFPPAKPVSLRTLRNQFPCKPCETSFPANPIYWMQKFVKFLM